MRQIGSDFLFADGNGRILGSRLNNAASSVSSTATGAGLVGLTETAAASASPATAFAILEGAGFQSFVSALRQNSMLKVLAEPNLVAMNGHEARFLAGGEFPVPVPQSGAGGGPATITVQYKKFGVQLNFVSYILDGDTIRLSVDPEVSSIDFFPRHRGQRNESSWIEYSQCPHGRRTPGKPDAGHRGLDAVAAQRRHATHSGTWRSAIRPRHRRRRCVVAGSS